MPVSRPPARPAAADAVSGDRLRGRLMAHALTRLLDRVRGARDVLPHLAALERGLLDAGLVVLDRVPRQGLAKICSQLSSLPLPEDDPPLHELLTRLMDALEAPQASAAGAMAPQAARRPAPRPVPRLPRGNTDHLPFDMERTVVIQEISHSDFMAATRGEAPTQRDESRLRDETR